MATDKLTYRLSKHLLHMARWSQMLPGLGRTLRTSPVFGRVATANLVSDVSGYPLPAEAPVEDLA
eukprot:1826432-Amphidinium_carterae.1